MRLCYIANARMPTEKAHGAQIVKTCEALARHGAAVELVVPRRHNPLAEDPFVYYGAEPLFTITRLAVIDSVALGRVGFWFESLNFALAALVYALRYPAEVYYSRDEMPLWLLSFFRKNVVWESHVGRYNVFVRRLMKAPRRAVVISQGLKDFYAERGASAQMLVAHDGVDLVAFERPESREAARKRLGLPLDKKLALYIGRLDGWKGVGTLFRAAALLPEDIEVVVIGGEEHQVKEYKKKYPTIHFLGARPYRELANNQAVADVLVLPNTGKDEVSSRFTSPLKLFSYMAAGKPIVASDLPSLHEVVDEESAFFFIPDDPSSLAEAVKRALREPGQKGERARHLVEHYSWDTRAEAILSYIGRV
jgi:glycosyltransferase involved in cell wall biosynthesis